RPGAAVRRVPDRRGVRVAPGGRAAPRGRTAVPAVGGHGPPGARPDHGGAAGGGRAGGRRRPGRRVAARRRPAPSGARRPGGRRARRARAGRARAAGVSPVIPAGLAAAGHGPDWAAWLERLPRLTADLLAEWSLAPDGEPAHGRTALVLPVRTEDGERAVL